MLHENNFTYDATMTYPFPRNVYSPVMWPFTLDHSYTLVCNIQPCPKNRYPGLWIVPVVVMMDYRYAYLLTPVLSYYKFGDLSYLHAS